MTNVGTETSAKIRLKPWELAVLAGEAVLGAGLVMAAIGTWVPRHVPGGSSISSPVWLAVGFLVLFWMLVPVLNIYARWRRGRELSILWTVVGSIAGAIVGGVIFALLA